MLLLLPRKQLLSPYLVSLLLVGCSSEQGRGDFAIANEQYTVETLGRLDQQKVAESSGLELATPEGDVWTHADGGNTAQLYKITRQGDLLQAVDLTPLQNIDWEDLAQDDERRLYIGDFGNNQNKRRNLCIYRLSGSRMQQVDTIQFTYPDQKAFPPRKPLRNFDCEAFYYYQDSLYLFTKNRGEGMWVKQYVLPAKPGRHVARLADSLQLSTWVTAADISPDGKRVALLGDGHVYLFERLAGRRLFDGLKTRLDISSSGQTEALIFVNNQDFLFSNEKGKLYSATRKK